MPHCLTLINRLRQLGYRITPQREMVIEALAHSGDHITADEIYEVVKNRSKAVNLATIYRTLDTLVAEGLVFRTNLLSGQEVYVTQGHGAHIHLICRNCGNVFNVAQDLALPLLEQINDLYHFRADWQHLSFVGVCQACQSKNPQSEKEAI